MANIGVKPVRKGMGLVHPLDGPLDDAGGSWREDQFTFKRLVDGDIKRLDPDEDGKTGKASNRADAGPKSSASRKSTSADAGTDAEPAPAGVDEPLRPTFPSADAPAVDPAKE